MEARWSPSSKQAARHFLRWAIATGLALLLVVDKGYAVQPPPPPLNLAQFERLVSKAELIAVGTVEEAGETEETVAAVLGVERWLKGNGAVHRVAIEEGSEPTARRLPGDGSKETGEARKTIVVHKAGPIRYHGRYQQGMRIVVFLEKIKDRDRFRPLGSGTYNQHLCAFPIEPGGISTFYFKFADDMTRYTETEKRFICLIERIESRHEGGAETCLED